MDLKLWLYLISCTVLTIPLECPCFLCNQINAISRVAQARSGEDLPNLAAFVTLYQPSTMIHSHKQDIPPKPSDVWLENPGWIGAPSASVKLDFA